MCGTKKEDVLTPRSRPKSRTTRFSGRTSNPSQSTDFTTNTTTTSSSYRDSKTSTSSNTSLASLRDSLPENPNIYSFTEICRATNNFLAKRLGHSTAWRCSLRNRDTVVIQRKCKISREEFREKLKSICSTHHGSLIKLLGASFSGEHIYLVYEYIHGANLADCLRNPKNPNFSPLSTWMSRMQVAIDVAQGLEYIHHDTGFHHVHNHIKSTSILVTEPSFKAKIAHFGTTEITGELIRHKIPAKSSDSGEITEEETEQTLTLSRSKSVRINGTKGYMAPESLSGGNIGQKADVFAFGVILLEIFSGEEPVKYVYGKTEKVASNEIFRRVSLLDTAREAVASPEDGKIRRWIDRRLRDSFPVQIAEKVTRLALACVDDEADRRPDMRHVAGKLSEYYLRSKKWTDKMKAPPGFTSSFAPR
ncbi:hypothetical protein AMTRI_Chr07g80100 [Amborella trichopoda]